MKMVLRYLALSMNHNRNTGKAADEKFVQASLNFLVNERDNKTSNLINYTMNVDFS